MKSTVENYVPFEEIIIPEKYLKIEIPSWDAVTEPTLTEVLEQYKAVAHVNTNVLTDDMVAALEIPNIQSVNQLKQYAMEYFQNNAKQRKFYNEVLPYIMTYYAESSQIVLNSEEKEAYLEDYFEQLATYAEAEDLDLETYASQVLGLIHQPMEALKDRGEEDFIYHLIAQQRYENQGLSLDEEAYENFIHQNVLHQNADEIEIRDRFPYVTFKKMMPEMTFTQTLFEHFSNKMKIVIRSEA